MAALGSTKENLMEEEEKETGSWQDLFSWRHRFVTVAIFAIVLWLGFRAISGPNGWVGYRNKKVQNQQLQQQLQQLQQENQELEHQVSALQNNDPNAIEKEAREQFHYAKPGEIVFVMPETNPGSTLAAGNMRADKK